VFVTSAQVGCSNTVGSDTTAATVTEQVFTISGLLHAYPVA
jgi:hypothetical protein